MSKKVAEVHSVEEFEQIIRTGESVLVDYYADWCGPCRALAPNVERVAAANAGKLRVIKVNIDELPELAERAKVREIPALHFYRDSQKVGVLTGFRTDVALTKELLRYRMIAAPGSDVRPREEAKGGTAKTSLAGRLFGLLGRSRAAKGADAEGPATSFRFIQSEQELADVIDSSFRAATPIFLHDPWCPISARAYRQMERLGGSLPTVDVSRQRALSVEIERRTGVRHESPQVIVLRDAVAVWHASHGRITTDSVRAAIGGPLAQAADRESHGVTKGVTR